MKNKKIINIISKYFYPVAAGIETNIMETYAVLVEKGWDVTVHTSRDSLTKKNCFPLGDDLVRGVKIKRYEFGTLGYLPKFDWSDTSVVCLHNFNVIPHLYVLLYSIFLKLLDRKKFALILTPHGGFNPEWSIFPGWIAIVKRWYHFTVGIFLINRIVDGMRAVSEWERNEIIKVGVKPKIVITISNGIEDEAYLDVVKLASSEIKKKVQGFGRYLIQIGRVYPIKNYETTIQAMVSLPEDIKFVIAGPVGDEKYLEYLKKLARKLKLDKRVIFIGVIRGIDKYYLIKKAQMMVHMAIWESFCNVVHEGLSQGLVCIVANNTALPLLVKDGVNGFCVETKDSNAVSQKINFVLDNKNSKKIEDMMTRNRKFGLEESWRSVASKMDNLYEGLSNRFI